MKVLVTTASKHGATAEIGAAIARRIREEGFEVVEAPVGQVASVADYDAVVIGSGVYVGRWLGEARELVKRESPSLRGRLVWLFSSGPVGDPPKPEVEPADVPEIVELSGALEHRVFPGRVDRSSLSIGERAIVSLVKAPEGDYRPWDDIRRFAEEMVAKLRQPVIA